MLIDFKETFAECMNGNSYDRIGLGIELRPAPQRFDCYRVFLDLICPPLEVFFTYVFQYPNETYGAPEDAGGEEPLELCPFRVAASPSVRARLGRPNRFHNA